MEQNNIEMEEMKRQLRILQGRLDRQVTVTEKQLRKAIDQKVESIRNRDKLGVFFSFFVAFLVTSILYCQGVNTWFQIVTFVLLVVNAIAGYCIKMNHPRVTAETDLVEMTQRMLRYKRNTRRCLAIGAPVALVWGVWYVNEVGAVLGADSVGRMVGLYVCFIIGGLIGGFIGYFTFYRPSMREADAVMSQIEDLFEESEE